MKTLNREQVLQIIESARVKGEIPKFLGAEILLRQNFAGRNLVEQNSVRLSFTGQISAGQI
jgi:hypothetical protein